MPPVSRQCLLISVTVIFVIAVVLRVGAALDYGHGWESRDSFILVNFDEAGSCRAALGGFDYTPFVGVQTITIASALGEPPGAIHGDARAVKRFCHSWTHLRVARVYSAIAGALTVVLVAGLSMMLFPAQPWMAIGASSLLALSGWHLSESMVGTVDAASIFFIYLLVCSVVWVKRSGMTFLRFGALLLLLIPALWTKYWVFAPFAFLAFVPASAWRRFISGLSAARLSVLLVAYALLFGLVSNPALPSAGQMFLPVLFYSLVPWTHMTTAGRTVALLAPWLAPLAMQVDVFVAYTSGGPEGRFGTSYGAIGWDKLTRNLVNLPIVATMGLGFPGVFFLAWGGWKARSSAMSSTWIALVPLFVFVLYMAFLAPVPYYRHYLPILPLLCVLSAYGMACLAPRWQPLAVSVVLVWQAALAWDLVGDYFDDPRRTLAAWYAANKPQRVLTTFYVNPPAHAGAQHRLVRPELGSRFDAQLRWGEYAILSENWYDTAFANELNGPFASTPEKLVKTVPAAVEFYRTALADKHPTLRLQTLASPPRFMPEMHLHYRFYGSFTQFVGDIAILERRL